MQRHQNICPLARQIPKVIILEKDLQASTIQYQNTLRRSQRHRKPTQKVLDNLQLHLNTKSTTPQINNNRKHCDQQLSSRPKEINKHRTHEKSTTLDSILAHLRFGCRNMKSIQHMSKHKTLSHMPPSTKLLNYNCPICTKCNMPRLRRNPPVSTAALHPGQMLQIDFAFNFNDNFRPIVSVLESIQPEANYAIQTLIKPTTPKSWNHVKDDVHKDVWYKAVFERYDKNHTVGLFSSPIPIEDVDSKATTLRAVSVFKVKSTSTPGLYDLYFRLCANGSTQIKGIHFDESHSPTPATWVLFLAIAIGAAYMYTVYTIDIDNAFQNTPRYPDEQKPIYVTIPPLYIPWLRQHFPHCVIKPAKRYVVQCFMNMQGMKSANRDFH